MKERLPYVIEEVPYKYLGTGTPSAWYCHHRDMPNCPVFGSIGDREKAAEICRQRNDSLGYGRKVGNV